MSILNPIQRPNLKKIKNVFKIMKLLVRIKNVFLKRFKLTPEQYELIGDNSYDKSAKFVFKGTSKIFKIKRSFFNAVFIIKYLLNSVPTIILNSNLNILMTTVLNIIFIFYLFLTSIYLFFQTNDV
jgi:hypothetical protein